jgi:hypothetical protein
MVPDVDSRGFERRPLVFVEDHLYHTGELLRAIAAARPDVLSHVTVCAVDRAGPDTELAVDDWLDAHPRLQIAANVRPRERVQTLTPGDLEAAPAFAKCLSRMVRPGGVLVQDVQLSTLAFLPADRWWESIYLAATARGLFADRPPAVRFLSNKHGYAATFGRDLLDAGFDPRDVMDKSELDRSVVPAIASLFDRSFPLELDALLPESGRRQWPVADHPVERRDIDSAFDLVLWPAPQGSELGGRLVAGDDHRVPLRDGSHESRTWEALVSDRLSGGAGLTVLSVGARVGPPEAERAELTNLAARHVHTLRSRLTDPQAIVTAHHAYRLDDRLSVGIVRRR